MGCEESASKHVGSVCSYAVLTPHIKDVHRRLVASLKRDRRRTNIWMDMQFESERSDLLFCVHPKQASRLNDLLKDQPTRKMHRARRTIYPVVLICGLRFAALDIQFFVLIEFA